MRVLGVLPVSRSGSLSLERKLAIASFNKLPDLSESSSVLARKQGHRQHTQPDLGQEVALPYVCIAAPGASFDPIHAAARGAAALERATFDSERAATAALRRAEVRAAGEAGVGASGAELEAARAELAAAKASHSKASTARAFSMVALKDLGKIQKNLAERHAHPGASAVHEISGDATAKVSEIRATIDSLNHAAESSLNATLAALNAHVVLKTDVGAACDADDAHAHVRLLASETDGDLAVALSARLASVSWFDGALPESLRSFLVHTPELAVESRRASVPARVRRVRALTHGHDRRTHWDVEKDDDASAALSLRVRAASVQLVGVDKLGEVELTVGCLDKTSGERNGANGACALGLAAPFAALASGVLSDGGARIDAGAVAASGGLSTIMSALGASEVGLEAFALGGVSQPALATTIATASAEGVVIAEQAEHEVEHGAEQALAAARRSVESNLGGSDSSSHYHDVAEDSSGRHRALLLEWPEEYSYSYGLNGVARRATGGLSLYCIDVDQSWSAVPLVSDEVEFDQSVVACLGFGGGAGTNLDHMNEGGGWVSETFGVSSVGGWLEMWETEKGEREFDEQRDEVTVFGGVASLRLYSYSYDAEHGDARALSATARYLHGVVGHADIDEVGWDETQDEPHGPWSSLETAGGTKTIWTGASTSENALTEFRADGVGPFEGIHTRVQWTPGKDDDGGYTVQGSLIVDPSVAEKFSLDTSLSLTSSTYWTPDSLAHSMSVSLTDDLAKDLFVSLDHRDQETSMSVIVDDDHEKPALRLDHLGISSRGKSFEISLPELVIAGEQVVDTLEVAGDWHGASDGTTTLALTASHEPALIPSFGLEHTTSVSIATFSLELLTAPPAMVLQLLSRVGLPFADLGVSAFEFIGKLVKLPARFDSESELTLRSGGPKSTYVRLGWDDNAGDGASVWADLVADDETYLKTFASVDHDSSGSLQGFVEELIIADTHVVANLSTSVTWDGAPPTFAIGARHDDALIPGFTLGLALKSDDGTVDFGAAIEDPHLSVYATVGSKSAFGQVSSGKLAFSDFERDGDLTLAVASRAAPSATLLLEYPDGVQTPSAALAQFKTKATVTTGLDVDRRRLEEQTDELLVELTVAQQFSYSFEDLSFSYDVGSCAEVDVVTQRDVDYATKLPSNPAHSDGPVGMIMAACLPSSLSADSADQGPSWMRMYSNGDEVVAMDGWVADIVDGAVSAAETIMEAVPGDEDDDDNDYKDYDDDTDGNDYGEACTDSDACRDGLFCSCEPDRRRLQSPSNDPAGRKLMFGYLITTCSCDWD